MRISGFAAASPYSVAALLDQLRWRAVVYADTPKVLARFRAMVPSNRKTVALVIGAHLLAKLKTEPAVDAAFVFDDTSALYACQQQIRDFPVVDIDVRDNGLWYPKALSTADVQDALVGGATMNDDLFVRVAKTLTERKATVLETTGRMPHEREVPYDSGIFGIMKAMEVLLIQEESKVPFELVVSTLAKFTFGMIPRQSVTALVTKHLPKSTTDLWQRALELGASPVGKQVSRAYREMCQTECTVHAAVQKFGLSAHAKDIAYLTAVFPPFPEAEFRVDLSEDSPTDYSGNQAVSEVVASTAKKRKKASCGGQST